MVTLSSNIITNLSLSDILPNEDNFPDTTERITCRLEIPLRYRHKPDNRILLDFEISPCGKKTVEQLLNESIPKYLSEKQQKVFERNGASIYFLWSNRKNAIMKKLQKCKPPHKQ